VLVPPAHAPLVLFTRAGVRKHCRKSHVEWLRRVDEEKASLGCRWAAYCTRQVIEEGGDDPRTTPVGSKRAREIIVEGHAQYQGTFSEAAVAVAQQGVAKSSSHGQSSSTISSSGAFGGRLSENASAAPLGSDRAFGGTTGKSLVPPKVEHRSASFENVVPPDMVCVPQDVPQDLSASLVAQDSKLTPNAQARKRLGEIADADGTAASVVSQGGSWGAVSGSWGATGANFFAWGMPPLKRGLSLADTRDALPPAVSTPVAECAHEDPESQAPPSRNESFLDSILAT
jgi:hypothetical protein